MKKEKLQSRMKKVGLVFIAILLIASGVQARPANKVKLSKQAMESFIEGIKSDNDGVKRDCIRYAGKYRITEVLDVLVEQFEKEKNPKTKILFMLTLYELDVKAGLEAIRQVLVNEENSHVKLVAEIILLGTKYYGTPATAKL